MLFDKFCILRTSRSGLIYEPTPRRSIKFGKMHIFDKFRTLFYAVNAYVLDK